jgi:hypothetical protein
VNAPPQPQHPHPQQQATMAAATMETTTTTTTTSSIVPVDLDSASVDVVVVVVQPHRNDVILGRGKRYQYHFGNLFFEGTRTPAYAQIKESRRFWLDLYCNIIPVLVVGMTWFALVVWCVRSRDVSCVSLLFFRDKRTVAAASPCIPSWRHGWPPVGAPSNLGGNCAAHCEPGGTLSQAKRRR